MDVGRLILNGIERRSFAEKLSKTVKLKVPRIT